MQQELERVLESLGPVRRFADPSEPREARLMAARGALPLPPSQLVSVLSALTCDPDPEIKDTAGQTLDGLPQHVVDPTLGAEVPAAVLQRFAERFHDDEGRLIQIAVNAATSDATACFLAALPHPKLIETLAQNQVRILRYPGLVDALGNNPLTGQATIERILEFLGFQRGEAPPLTGRATSEQPDEAPPPFDPDDPTGLPHEALAETPEEQTPEKREERSQNLLAVIQDLTVVEKIKLARFGNAEARSLLVRDRNKIVATAVVRSPRVAENEVLSFAKSRNLSDEVIRIISNTREWTRKYAVQLALTKNPRTPTRAALKFLSFLSDRDLRAIMRSRDVPGPVSQQARRILSRKGKV